MNAVDSMKRVARWCSRARSWRRRVAPGGLLPGAIGLTAQALVALVLLSPAHAQPPKQLWVLREPDEIVEYDPATFVARRTVRVPRRVLEHPEYLSVNGHGQMLFAAPRDAQWGGGEMARTGDRVWLWDGRQAREWKRGPDCFLSAGGESLVWFENRFETVTEPSGLERSVRASFRVWRTDLAGGKPETIASVSPSGWCRCTTGTCSESCPEWSFWAPAGVVGDFFVVTRWTPGQIGSTYHDSVLYRRSGRTWRGEKLVQPLERPLAASENGAVLVAALPDGGCCGWENESNDQTLLLRDGKVSVLYDELARYGNRDYDVSFYTQDARLAPGNAMVAYTIVSTARAGGEIRRSLDGKENPEAAARIRTALGELPTVEVVPVGGEPVGGEPRSTTIARRAALVGWLSDRDLLVAQDGRLAVYDARGTRRRETPIRLRSAADAFLR